MSGLAVPNCHCNLRKCLMLRKIWLRRLVDNSLRWAQTHAPPQMDLVMLRLQEGEGKGREEKKREEKRRDAK